MTYYKIIKNELVIGVGTKFIEWNPSVERFLYCDTDKAQYIQDIFTLKLYHIDWLRNVNMAAPEVDYAMAEIIDATEYDELYEQIRENQQVPYVPTPPPEPEPEPEPEPTPIETPMTIQQMREKIIEQGEMIDMLTECLLEVSEIIYDE